MSLYAVIMAGGKGERLWPVSTPKSPKQLIAFKNGKSLLKTTLERLLPLTPARNICCVTGKDTADAVMAELSDIPKENILVEPFGRNTAPCIAFAAAWISRRDRKAVMAVFPSDHDISDGDSFRDALTFGERFLSRNPGMLLTLGIMPSYAETGYGYIAPGKQIIEDSSQKLFHVERFHEKPDAPRAEEYIKSGCLWNAGMFIWSVSTIINEFERHTPELHEGLVKLMNSDFGKEDILEFYSSSKASSIDYAIMEHAENVGVIPVSFDWNDVGSWSAVEKLLDMDAFSNAAHGKVFAYESSNNVIWSSGKKIVLIGIEDMAIVEGEEAILICRKDRAQDVSRVLKMMGSNEK